MNCCVFEVFLAFHLNKISKYIHNFWKELFAKTWNVLFRVKRFFSGAGIPVKIS